MKSIAGQPLAVDELTQGRIEHAPSSSLRAAAVSTPSTPSATPGASGLIKAFQRRWRLAVGLAVVATPIVVALTWRFLPPTRYTAEALLLVEEKQPTLITPTREYRSDPETDHRTQLALIKSLVLSKAVAQPEVAELNIIKQQGDPADWLEQQIKADFKGKILSLAMTGDNPDDVTTVVKSVTRAYLSEVANKEKLQRLDRNRSLEEHYEKLEKQLESKRKTLRDLSATVGSKDKQTLSTQQRLAVSRQSKAESELLETQSDLKRAMAELKVLQNREQKRGAADPKEEPAAPLSDDDLEKAVQSDPDLQELLRKEDHLRAVVTNNKHVARNPSDPSVRNPQKELIRVQKQRQAFENRLRSDLQAEKTAPPPKRARGPSRAWSSSRIRSKSWPGWNANFERRSASFPVILKSWTRRPSKWNRSRPRSRAPSRWRN